MNLKKHTILIVEDEIPVVELLMQLLFDYHIIISTTGRKALDIIKSEGIDLIILDIRLPDIDGFQICDELKMDDKLQRIPIIFLSGDASIDTKIRAFNNGAVDYITKPFEKDDLIIRINCQLDKLSKFEKEINFLQMDHNLIEEKMIQLEKCLKKTKQVENNFKSIVELMPAPVFVCEWKNDIIVYANSAFCKMCGYSIDELLDKCVDMLVPDEILEKRKEMKSRMTDDQLEEMMGTNRSHQMWIVHKNKDLVFKPAIFYNWRTNGDRFITMIFLDSPQEIKYNSIHTDLQSSLEKIKDDYFRRRSTD